MAIVIDLIAIVVFAILARAAHQTDEMQFNALGVAETAWPFLVGVLVAWLLLRIFAREADGFSMKAGATVWIITVLTGLGTWAIRHSDFPHWSFIIVASTVSAILLFGWRGIARLVRKPKARIA